MSAAAPSPVPSIPVDDALRLFLALHFPHGLPPGVDETELLERARRKIAADRPAWAAAANPGGEPRAPSLAGRGHWASADSEAVPLDPEERYFFERRQQARQNGEIRRQEARASQAADERRRRVRPDVEGLDAATLERAQHIRSLLVEHVHAAFALRHAAAPASALSAPDLPHLGLGGAALAPPSAPGPVLSPSPASLAGDESPALRVDERATLSVDDDGSRRRRRH